MGKIEKRVYSDTELDSLYMMAYPIILPNHSGCIAHTVLKKEYPIQSCSHFKSCIQYAVILTTEQQSIYNCVQNIKLSLQCSFHSHSLKLPTYKSRPTSINIVLWIYTPLFTIKPMFLHVTRRYLLLFTVKIQNFLDLLVGISLPKIWYFSHPVTYSITIDTIIHISSILIYSPGQSWLKVHFSPTIGFLWRVKCVLLYILIGF